MEIRFFEAGRIEENKLSYAIIASRYQGKWVFVRQKVKTTWEIPGGRKEPDEPIIQTAQRELFEETGALKFSLQEISDYAVTRQETRYGRLFFAEITQLGPLPDLEIGEIRFEEQLPSPLTYPDIQPRLMQYLMEKLVDEGRITPVAEQNFAAWLELGLRLWPEHSREELQTTFLEILQSPRQAGFLFHVGQEYVGFINVSMRVDYVEGSNSSPVGYVEGIYVHNSFRKQGIARKLVEQGERWAKERGCSEMASDIEEHNLVSYDFHTRVGFREANRIICFIKQIY